MSDIDEDGYHDRDDDPDDDEDYDEGHHAPVVDDVDENQDAAPELYYPDVETFVAIWLAPTYRRSLDAPGRTWCPRWWAHPEAISRLEALWRAWEHLRLDPTLGMSTWWREHADVHMAVLMSEEAGPFKGCTLQRGHVTRLAPLPLEPAPEGFFDPM